MGYKTQWSRREAILRINEAVEKGKSPIDPDYAPADLIESMVNFLLPCWRFVSVKTTGYKIEFLGMDTVESPSYFFSIILIFNFTHFIKMKILEKNAFTEI